MKQTLQALLFALVAITMPIGTWAQESSAEAKWGTSAQSLTNEGTLADAIAAAYRYDEEIGRYIATDIAYIQLLSNVTTDYSHIIYGGTFTLDFNGQTLTSDRYTLDIRNEGTSVTLADYFEEAAGKVISTGDGVAAIVLANGASLTIENGSYEAAGTAVMVLGSSATITGGTFTADENSYTIVNDGSTLSISGGSFGGTNIRGSVYIGSSSSTTITGGTFTAGEDGYTIKNEGGTLSISGGSFGGTGIESSVHIGSSSSTTITGGTFAEGYNGTIEYRGGKLDLTGYPTTATEGTTPLTDISVYSWAAVAVGAETLALPTGYCFYDSDAQAVTALEAYEKYTIGAWAVEAKWGTSAQSLTNEGTLAEAIAAAKASSDVAYIQLQSDVTATDYYIIKGGTFTLDLNGHTLTRDGYTLDIRNEGTSITLTDNSEDVTGRVVCTSGSASAINLMFGANLTITSGSYESAATTVYVGSGSFTTITGGTFTGGSGMYTISNSEGTLSISGGTFGGSDGYLASVYTSSSSVSTTITGGTFAEGTRGAIVFSGGKLDLTDYPTTATEGTTPLTDISVYSFSAVTVGDETLALPTGYCFYLGEQAVTALEAGEKYTIKTRGEDTTGIEEPESTVNGEQRAVIYNLSGRRVTHPTKGIYIVNGKKVIFK